MVHGRIMIVEDEGLVADDLASCIESFGYEVVGIADTVDAATALAESTKPDLALLDIQLKGDNDGIHLAHELRRRHIGFVYLTAHSDAAILERAQVTEPLGYVLKPFGARDMLPVLQTAMYRHSAELRLRGMEHWLSTTLSSIGDGVLVTDLEGRVTYLNRVAERIAGLTRREAVGRDFMTVLPLVYGAGAPVQDNVATRAISQRATVSIEPGLDLMRPDGSRVGIDDCASPVCDEKGEVTGAVVVFRDVTERRRTEQRRREAELRMVEAEKMENLAVLANGLAHDLNNVLTTILGNVSLCRMSPGAGPMMDLLQAAENGTRAATEMCRRMLQGVGAQPIQPTAVEVAALVHECVRRERGAAGDLIEFHVRLERPEIHVLADQVQVGQVLANLLRNATEALTGRRGNIVVRSGSLRLPTEFLPARSPANDLAPGDYVWIEVSDDGPGIPEDVKARVFQPFFTTKADGTGLGLANVHSIVRRHRGAVTVESEGGLGTVFRVFLPAHAPGPATIPTPPRGARTAIRTVLVVDDDHAVRQITSRLLSARKWPCHEAQSGAAALEMLGNGLVVDAVVLDMLMPDASGIETLHAIRARYPELPVLLVSGLGATTAPDLAADPHTEFLTKPFMIEGLVAAIERWSPADHAPLRSLGGPPSTNAPDIPDAPPSPRRRVARRERGRAARPGLAGRRPAVRADREHRVPRREPARVPHAAAATEGPLIPCGARAGADVVDQRPRTGPPAPSRRRRRCSPRQRQTRTDPCVMPRRAAISGPDKPRK